MAERWASLLLAGLLALPPAAPARAAGTQSVPTDLDFDECTIMASNDFGTLRACPGYKGIPVLLDDNNGNIAMSFGLTSTTEPAARQRLPRRGHVDGAIVWRLGNVAGRWTPLAAIVRYALEADGKAPAAEVLAVTRIAPGKTCVVGYVDATASSEAALPVAEAMADKSGSFDCGTAPVKAAGFRAW